jgi:hypothetical protein
MCFSATSKTLAVLFRGLEHCAPLPKQMNRFSAIFLALALASDYYLCVAERWVGLKTNDATGFRIA